MAGFNALILAGSRPGETDPAAAYAGVAHKALIVLEGETLLARVAAALRAAGADRIVAIGDEPGVVAEAMRLGLEILAPAAGPAESVAAALEALGTPLLVTTADHALLRGDWITQFIADAPREADVAILLAPEALVQAAAPGTKRTYLAFRDGRFSGCNLFLLATPTAGRAIDLWRTVQAHRKQPWKIAWLLGPRTLLAYALGRLTLDQAIRRLGGQAGVQARAVKSAFGLAAVDVDKPADLDLVRAITSKG